MTWLLLSTAALVIVMTACVFFGLATAAHIDLGDTADIDDDDEDQDQDEPTIAVDPVYSGPHLFVNPVPPCAIRHIGASGQHDRYPITDRSRSFWIDYCNASWHLPDREPGATR